MERWGDRRNWEGYADPTPYRALSRVSPKRAGERRVDTGQAIHSVLAAADRIGTGANSPTDAIYREAMLFSFYTLVRWDEIAQALWSDIDWAGRRWVVPAEWSSDGYRRDIALVPQVLRLLESAKKVGKHGARDWLFAENGEQMSHKRWHKLRKSVLSRAPEIAVMGFKATALGVLVEKCQGVSEGLIRRCVNGRVTCESDRQAQLRIMQTWANYLDAHRVRRG